jgi:hypothetical protein
MWQSGGFYVVKAALLRHMSIKFLIIKYGTAYLCRSAQAGAVIGTFALAPISWIRGGRKLPLFSAVMPRVAATWMLGGGFAGAGGLIAMAIVNKSPSKVPLHISGVDDRAYRISKNPKVEKINDFVTAGALASLMTGRSLTGKGFFGHIGIGLAWATVGEY